ncbi:hypothetical protein SAMN05444274_104129 [Mariniphaga anaerophila]|uniref:Two component regulator propeller n=1 Tax=Mariniphaga anaerophila TaxID=1484053 RepID=A0A1M5A031_9BACT|nr:hypothetical protein [Mariniphaga anaerophila]SHF23625.1 hypothetical protein SAMN05444274_104129 [Mariniphaga anaerophila]
MKQVKFFLFIGLILPFTILGQPIENQTIKQDVAIRHTKREGFTDEKVKAIFLENNMPVAIIENSVYKWDGKNWLPAPVQHRKRNTLFSGLPEKVGAVLCSITYNGKNFAGTENGLYCSESGKNKWETVLPGDDKYRWAPSDVSVLTEDSEGRLWFGAEQGVGCLQKNTWKLYAGDEGLPYNRFTCAAAGPDGIVWFGTEKGAIRFKNGQFHYRFSLRWLPDDFVNDVVVQKNGTAWFATNKGVGQIAPRSMTFEQKAHYFTRQTETRHQRMGFIAPNELEVPYDTASFKHGISDNDGKYTSMYGSAQAFRYAVTGSQEAKKLARRSFEACKWLVDITHEPRFPARVIVPHDWPEPLADPEYSHQMNIRTQQNDPFWKDINPRFVKSKDGKYLWKCDTSSDELAGHYFFYGIYYDLVAETEEEKAPVREVVADITDHLIRNGFFLRDHDGKATRWGNFSPEFCNSIWGWDQRGLNSMMMLSFLNVAKHVTGNAKYDKVAQMLRNEHNYHINAMHGKEFFPPDNVVPWDNNLCLMSMLGLMNYETDPELLIMYRMSLENSWLHISKQKNAFWDALYSAMAQKFAQQVAEGYFNNENVFPEAGSFTNKAVSTLAEYPDLGNHIKEMLQQIPLDLIGYEMDNTHRLDVVQDPAPGQDPTVGWRKDGFALPVDERGHVRQDRDGFALHFKEVGGVNAEQEGTFFLLPYYMARYYKLIK